MNAFRQGKKVHRVVKERTTTLKKEVSCSGNREKGRVSGATLLQRVSDTHGRWRVDSNSEKAARATSLLRRHRTAPLDSGDEELERDSSCQREKKHSVAERKPYTRAHRREGASGE